MSRSKPVDRSPNPCTRWFEWHGGKEGGFVHYWDKEAKQNVELALPFTFLLLDELRTISGWSNESDSRIFANEVRDSTTEPLVVKSFKGGEIASGIYREIEKDVKAAGGKFTTSLYLAYRDGAEYRLGNLRITRSTAHAWIEFQKSLKTQPNVIYTRAVTIASYKEGKNGSVVYRVPVFSLVDVSKPAESAAQALDEMLQAYLDNYFKRTHVDQVVEDDDDETQQEPIPLTADDIPFSCLLPLLLPMLGAIMG